jgi:hypothetical protein
MREPDARAIVRLQARLFNADDVAGAERHAALSGVHHAALDGLARQGALLEVAVAYRALLRAHPDDALWRERLARIEGILAPLPNADHDPRRDAIDAMVARGALAEAFAALRELCREARDAALEQRAEALRALLFEPAHTRPYRPLGLEEAAQALSSNRLRGLTSPDARPLADARRRWRPGVCDDPGALRGGGARGHRGRRSRAGPSWPSGPSYARALRPAGFACKTRSAACARCSRGASPSASTAPRPRPSPCPRSIASCGPVVCGRRASSRGACSRGPTATWRRSSRCAWPTSTWCSTRPRPSLRAGATARPESAQGALEVAIVRTDGEAPVGAAESEPRGGGPGQRHRPTPPRRAARGQVVKSRRRGAGPYTRDESPPARAGR